MVEGTALTARRTDLDPFDGNAPSSTVPSPRRRRADIHLLPAPMAAKLVGRPVELVLPRERAFSPVPFGGGSTQRLRPVADASGRLQAIRQDAAVAQRVGLPLPMPARAAIAHGNAIKLLRPAA